MDFTIKYLDGTTVNYKNIRGLQVVDGVWMITPSGHRKKVEVLREAIDVIVAHIQPVHKISSVIKAEANPTKVGE